jgi:MOSC domain-containing protein YiiM
MHGRLERIWIKRAKGGPMDEAPRATLVARRGLAGNANQGGRRQVTVLSLEAWTAITAGVAGPIDPVERRANLLVSGLDLRGSRGQILRVGHCRLLVHGETKPCERMAEVAPGLQQGLRAPWAGGVFAEVLDHGEIQAGDVVTLEAAAPPGDVPGDAA